MSNESPAIVPSTRRDFMIGAAGVGASICAATAWAAPSKDPTKRIVGLTRRRDTWALLNVNMGAFVPTWAASGDQFLAIGEGSGLETPATESFYGRVYRLRGDPPKPTMETLPGYPFMPLKLLPTEYAECRNAGILAVGTRIYAMLVTPNHPYIGADGNFMPGWRQSAAKIIYSDDDGRTWRNRDGSQPVVFDKWNERSKRNMLFHEEPFNFHKFLQMGKGYQDNRDGYIYLYGSRNEAEIILARVAKAQVMNRDAYEFFTGSRPDGGAMWSKAMGDVGTVFRFPAGWVSSKDTDGMVPSGWNFSVVYNNPLGVYMLVGQGTGVGPDGGWHGTLPYLGFWVGPTPWGPFRQIHEDRAWQPGESVSARPYNPQIPPKWISADGRSFWLVWSDYEVKTAAAGVNNPDAGVVEFLKKKNPKTDAEFARWFDEWNREHMVSLGMNMQRVDLLIE